MSGRRGPDPGAQPGPDGDDDAFDDAFDDDSEPAGAAGSGAAGSGGGGSGGGGGGVGRSVDDPRDTLTAAFSTAGGGAGAFVDARAPERPVARPPLEVAAELVIAEMALAILEDERSVHLDGDELLAYDELDPDDIAAELLEQREQEHDDFAQAEAHRLAWYVRGWQMQMDYAFDFAMSGHALPDRMIALRGAIQAAITRVGGIPSVRVGSYVWALRRSRSSMTEPFISPWLRSRSVPEELEGVLPPPTDTPEWRKAAEAAIVLSATGELTGARANPNLVLAVTHSLATLNDARRAMGLSVLRLSDLDRSAGRTIVRDAGDRTFDVQRTLAP